MIREQSLELVARLFFDISLARAGLLSIEEMITKLDGITKALAALTGDEAPDYVVESIRALSDSGDREAVVDMFLYAVIATITVLMKMAEDEDPMQAAARWN